MLRYIGGKQPESKRRRADANRKSRYGLLPKVFDDLLEKQGGKCGICAANITWPKVPHVHHCHKTEKVRGLLCTRCNRAIGMFGDDPNLLQRAADYTRMPVTPTGSSYQLPIGGLPQKPGGKCGAG
jgi:hypothetical protein